MMLRPGGGGGGGMSYGFLYLCCSASGISLKQTKSMANYLVVVDQFTPGYQFTPTLNFLEDLYTR